MSKENVFILVYFFSQINIVIVLVGILFLEYLRRKEKKGILPFIIIIIGLVIIILLDMIRFYLGYSLVFLLMFVFLYIILMPIWLWNCSRYWSQTNKVLFFTGLIFPTFSVGFYITKFFIDISNIWGAIFLAGTFFNTYFFVIDFLIKTAGGYKKTKLRKFSKIFY